MTYREIPAIARWTLAALVASGLMVVAVMVSDTLELRLYDEILGGQKIDFARVEANDRRQLIVAIVTLVVSPLTISLFLRWFYVGNRLARDLGATLRFRPGWAVGYFFIPFLNLYRPAQAMHDLHRAARGAPTDRTLVTLWWIVLWGSGAVSRGVRIMSQRAEQTLESFRQVTLVSALSGIVDLLVVVATIALVWKIASGLADRVAEAEVEASALPTL